MTLNMKATVDAMLHRKPLPARNFESVFLLQFNLLYFIQELRSADL